MNNIVILLTMIYIFILSIAGYAMMGIDKSRAVRGKWRITERTLFLIALLGGGIGSYLGMKCFHHKNRHLSFRILLPLAAMADLVLIGLLVKKVIS